MGIFPLTSVTHPIHGYGVGGPCVDLSIDGIDEDPPDDVSHHNGSGANQRPPNRGVPLTHEKRQDNRGRHRAAFNNRPQRWPKEPVKCLRGEPQTPIETNPRRHLQQMAEGHRHAERGKKNSDKAPGYHWPPPNPVMRWSSFCLPSQWQFFNRMNENQVPKISTRLNTCSPRRRLQPPSPGALARQGFQGAFPSTSVSGVGLMRGPGPIHSAD